MKKLEKPRKELLLSIYDHKPLEAEFEKKTSLDLLEIIDKGHVLQEGDEEQTVDWDPINKAENVLIYRLSGNLLDAINKDLVTELNRIIDKQNEIIETFKNHRHCLDKTYGEKPVW